MKLRIYGLMTGLFILGVLCGILLTMGIAKKQIRSLTGSSTPEIGSVLVRLLDHKLSLTAEQEKAVREVLRESEKEVLPVRREFRTRAFGLIKDLQPRIAEELDAGQKKKLDTFVDGLLNTWQLSEDPDAAANPEN